eukprot:m.288442 g.288442  ORF g.288442 m.288442 type:complete len:76 (-) comp17790_c0_seq39:7084-7311(-)
MLINRLSKKLCTFLSSKYQRYVAIVSGSKHVQFTSYGSETMALTFKLAAMMTQLLSWSFLVNNVALLHASVLLNG